MPRTLLLLSLARRFSFISARPVVAALSLLNNNSSKRHLRIKKKEEKQRKCCCLLLLLLFVLFETAALTFDSQIFTVSVLSSRSTRLDGIYSCLMCYLVIVHYPSIFGNQFDFVRADNHTHGIHRFHPNSSEVNKLLADFGCMDSLRKKKENNNNK